MTDPRTTRWWADGRAGRWAGVGMAVALALALLAGARLMVEYRDCALLGWDTYPLIENSRIQSSADLREIFSTSLMGKESGGLYYRPLLKLSFALDHALWGVWAPGYHLSSTLILIATALAVGLLASRLASGDAVAAGLAALVFFAIHPVHATLVAVPSRRADTLCLLFTCLSLCAIWRSARTPSSRGATAAVLAGLALLSKETGLLTLPLAALAVFVHVQAPSLRARAMRTARLVLPMVVVVAVVVLARLRVLGGLVGERPVRESDLAWAAVQMFGHIVRAAWFGIPFADLPGAAFRIVALVLLASGATVLALAGRDRGWSAVAMPGLAVAAAWLVLAAVTYAIGIVFQPWYLLSPLAAFAVVTGLLVSAASDALRRHGAAKAAALVALACLALIIVRLASYSPLFGRAEGWHEASDVQRSYLNTLAGRIAAAGPGSVVRAPRVPQLLTRTADGSRAVGVAMLAGYSVDAWARLEFPDRKIRVVYGRVGDTGADPDGVVVVLGNVRDSGAAAGATRGQGR